MNQQVANYHTVGYGCDPTSLRVEKLQITIFEAAYNLSRLMTFRRLARPVNKGVVRAVVQV